MVMRFLTPSDGIVDDSGTGGGIVNTDPVTRPIAPRDRPPSSEPVVPKTGFATLGGSSLIGPGSFDPGGGGTNVDPVSKNPPTLTPTSGGGGGDTGGGGGGGQGGSGGGGGSSGGDQPSNMHMPGEIWTLGPGQGCAPGYAQQMTADGRWTCIPMSDFQKIFKGDFSPLFPGNAPAGVAPVDPNSSVSVGGQFLGTAQDVADSFASTGEAPPPPSGTQGTGGVSTGGGATTGGQSGGGGGVNTGSGSTIDRLIDLVAAQYAGAGVKGGGSGFDGLVSGPLATSVTGEDATPASGSGSKGLLLFVFLVVAAGLGYWYYKKHKSGG